MGFSILTIMELFELFGNLASTLFKRTKKKNEKVMDVDKQVAANNNPKEVDSTVL